MQHGPAVISECPVTASAPSDIGVGDGQRRDPDRPEADERFDTARITAAVDALAAKHAGREDVFRSAMAQLLKAEMIAARATAQAVLLKDRHGRRCAERLCFVQDEIIRILFSAATRHLYRSPIPSGAERMAVVATGGYGRGLMAPESDIDLLFILPYKQTAWGEQVAEAILYCLWDMGLKVGHATRSVDELIRQARGDMTIRTAILETRFLTGDQPLYDELVDAVRQGSGAGHRRRIRHREARRTRRAASPRRAVALSGRAQRQGRQGRPARPAYAVLDREIRLPRARDRRTARTRRVRRAGIPHLPPLRRFPVVGPLQHPFLLGPRRRAAVVRHAARDRDPARLYLASRHAGCRTLHEALLPGRQGRRRSHRDPVRQAGRPAGQARAGAEPDDGAAAAEHEPAAGARQRRFHRRQQPHQSRRARCLQARPGQPDPDLPPRPEEQSRLSSRRHAHGDALAEADQHPAARRSRSQPAVHGNPDLERRRNRAAAHERDRRARPFHPRLRQDRVDDAVQHVPPLYGGRASVALRRLSAGDRTRRQRRIHRRQRPDAQDSPRAPRR